MAAPLILIPPSEGKAPGGRGAPWSAGRMRNAELDSARRTVLDALVTTMEQPAAKLGMLLGVKGVALEAAVSANRSVLTSRTRPAIDRYTGVLYDALDAATLPTNAMRRLRAQVLILSGALGLVAPGDPIPDYKLKMGASLPGVGKVSTFWRPQLDAVLGPLTVRRTVWNLLPNEHAAAWSGPDPTAREITVRFLDDVVRNGRRQLVTVSHWNKLLKGALVRHLLTEQLTNPAGLAAFDHPQGYRYDPLLTETNGRHTVASLVARR